MAKTKSGVYYNDPRPVERGDYGVRVARNGFDATTSGDSNLLFNSGWRIIQIVKVISEENKKIIIDETQNIPSSYVFYEKDIMGVGNWNCAVDEKWFYLPLEIYEYQDPATTRIYSYRKQYKIYHGLGYCPLFFKSEFCADVPGYYLLTNVDIREDADYPYTSKPSYYDGSSKNYGIKSKSYTRNKIPTAGETRGCGINTAIQSKLVMAVKTEKSKAPDYEYEGQAYPVPCPSWCVPQDSNAQTTKIDDYEAFGFFAYNQSGSVYDTEGQPLMEYPVGWSWSGGQGERYTLVDQWGAAVTDARKSLVILRSPMVAPDIEEITLS